MRIAVLGTTPMTAECMMEFNHCSWEIAAVISLPEKKRPLNSINLELFLKGGGRT